MEWLQFSIFFITALALWLCTISEANADRRNIANTLQEMRDQIKELNYRISTLEDKKKK